MIYFAKITVGEPSSLSIIFNLLHRDRFRNQEDDTYKYMLSLPEYDRWSLGGVLIVYSKSKERLMRQMEDAPIRRAVNNYGIVEFGELDDAKIRELIEQGQIYTFGRSWGKVKPADVRRHVARIEKRKCEGRSVEKTEKYRFNIETLIDNGMDEYQIAQLVNTKRSRLPYFAMDSKTNGNPMTVVVEKHEGDPAHLFDETQFDAYGLSKTGSVLVF